MDITKSGITHDLEQAKDKGLSNLMIWDSKAMSNEDGYVPVGAPFMGPESVELIHYTMDEAKRLSMNLGLVSSSGWNAGGSWVTPEMAGKNELKIEVMNLWINRFADDKKLPDDQKFTSTNINADGSTRFSAAEPWREITADLLGTYRLLPSVQVPVNSTDFFKS